MKPGEREDSPEFDLVLACLRWPQERVDGDRIQSLVRGPIRWPYLLEIVHHHKVVPLFFRNLETFAPGYIPDEPGAVLRAGAVANAHTCLERISHLLLLSRRFREREIDLRIFKGIPLAITAFQDPTLRDAGDIDLLIAEKDLYRAGEILRVRATFDLNRKRVSLRAACVPTSRIRRIFPTNTPVTGSSSTCTGAFFETRFYPPTPVWRTPARNGCPLALSASRPCPLPGCCFISACTEHWTAGCV